MTAHDDILRLQREAEYFAEWTSAQAGLQEPDIEVLIERYLDCRRLSADAVRDVTDRYLHRARWALDDVIEELQNELRARLAHALPLEAIRVEGYGGMRKKLFEYMLLHRGRPVSASQVRALTGDQIHTERRLRELRDLGIQIEAVHRGGENTYELTSDSLDIDYAMEKLVPRLVAKIPGWSPARQAQALAELSLG